MRAHTLLTGLATLALVTGASDAAADSDCPAGELCDAATATCLPMCASDADCAAGLACVDGICQ